MARLLVLLCVSALFVLGCGADSNRIVGTWDYRDSQSTGVYVFNEDGTFNLTGDGGGHKMSAKGTYKIEDNKTLNLDYSELILNDKNLFDDPQLSRKAGTVKSGMLWHTDTDLELTQQNGVVQRLLKR